ncbi:piggyBac transposable element-derived protein 4-like [Penaeus japonicus]|uniref:piggyBac transposable element-derived protein 4-like n=1 Tax=Penaeus japonicus TaxID=27405 RepID=UPI001C70D0ED|nr:piggyBac transposable element-derived protein 4-like [Penaeus japonicus]
MRPVIDAISRQFSSVYVPSQKVTVDESLWRFQGRFCSIIFNRTKRARFGVKVYKLCISDDSTERLQNLRRHGQSQHTNAIGTVCANRKYMPRDLQTKKRGDVDFRSSPTGMLCLQWRDKKPVTMLSTVYASGSVIDTSQRWVVRTKPKVVVDYNVGMKGVDLSDQLAQSYPTVRKSIRWYKVLFYLFDMAVVNAFIVHKALGGRLTQLDFRSELVHGKMKELTREGRYLESWASSPDGAATAGSNSALRGEVAREAMQAMQAVQQKREEEGHQKHVPRLYNPKTWYCPLDFCPVLRKER